MNSPFEMFVLPAATAFGLLYFPYHFSFKLFTLLPTSILFYRMYNKSQDPQIPETFLREMIHNHEDLKDLFKIESTATLDYKCEWQKLPEKDEFPEFHTKFF